MLFHDHEFRSAIDAQVHRTVKRWNDLVTISTYIASQYEHL